MKAISPDNPVLATINKVVDLMWVSILWCIICLPMIFGLFFGLEFLVGEEIYLFVMLMCPICALTVGPASAALYYSVVKVIRRERGYITKSFFHGFKINFKLGALTSLIYGVFIAIMYFDIKYSLLMAIHNESTFSLILCGVFLCVIGFSLVILVWLNPVLSRFELNLKTLLKNTFLISVKNIFRTLILVIFWIGIGFVVFEMLLSSSLARFASLLPFFLPGVSALVRSFVIEPVFKKLSSDVEDNGEDENPDHWYNE